MANSLVALGVNTPQNNTLQAYDQSQANALNAKTTQMQQARQGLEWVGSMALGAMGGKLDGAVNPERWGQGLDMLSKSGVDAIAIDFLRSRPDLAPVVARASLDTMQQLQVARDERDYQLALRNFDLRVQEAAEARQARAAAAAKPIEVNNQLVDPKTYQVLGDFRTQPVSERPLTPQERAQWGIPETDTRPYSIKPGEAPSLIGGSGTTVNVNPEGADTALDKALSAEEGKNWARYKQAGVVSGSNAQDFQILDELINMAPQGPIVGQLATAFPGFNSAGAAFQSIVKRIAPTQRVEGSGSTSDIEYNGMLQAMPSLLNDPSANRMILSIIKGKAQIDMQRAQIITKYQNDEISVGEARRALDELNQVSVLTPEMRRSLIGVGGSGDLQQAIPNAGEVVDGYRFQGGNPADRNSWVKVD